MSVNKFIGLGNLGADPDLRYLPDGRGVANFSIACSERWKDKNTGEQKENTEWIRCVCFGRRGEVIAEHFKKGNQIYIEGKMRTRMYERDGVKHYTTEIVVDDFQFVGKSDSGAGDAKAQQQAAAYGTGASSAKSNTKTQGYTGNQNMPPVPPVPDYDDFDDSDIPF